jgi:hypothetical protein
MTIEEGKASELDADKRLNILPFQLSAKALAVTKADPHSSCPTAKLDAADKDKENSAYNS